MSTTGGAPTDPPAGRIEVQLPDARDPTSAVFDAVRARLEGERPFPLRDVAFEARVDRDVLARLFVAAGRLRDDDRYGIEDLGYARDLHAMLERFEVDVLERALRLHQRAATTVAVNQLAILRGHPGLNPLLAPDAELRPEVVDLIVDEADRLLPTVQRLLARDHHVALLRLLDTDVVASASRTGDDDVQLAVGFVDLVGFTRLSATVDPAGVAEVLGGFEDKVHDAANAVSDVIVVKFIGDAAMLVSGELDRLVDVCLRVLEEPFLAGDEVERRAGASYGSVHVRDGDYVGTAVNTAARLTDLARPGALLVDGVAEEHLGDRWRASLLPLRKLKGLGTSRHLRVRRVDDG